MNRRASHFLITGVSRNNHAVEPYFWLLFVDKKDFEVLTTWPCMHVFDTEEEESYDGLIRLIESL